MPLLHLGHPFEGSEPGLGFVTESYPLVELDVTKANEDAIPRRDGLSQVHKPGSAIWPFQPVGWTWTLRETDPAGWAAVVEVERAALARKPRMFIVGQAPIHEGVAGEAPEGDGGGCAGQDGRALWGRDGLTGLLPGIPGRTSPTALLKCLGLPMHHNSSELSLRAPAIGPRNWLIAGTKGGAIATTDLLSTLGSARLHRPAPETTLTELLQPLPTWPINRVAELTPKAMPAAGA